MEKTNILAIILIVIGLSLVLYGVLELHNMHKHDIREMPVVGEQYYLVKKENPFDQDTIKILIVEVKENRYGETWIKYYHYSEKDGSVIEIPYTSDWKSIGRIFEKYK